MNRITVLFALMLTPLAGAQAQSVYAGASQPPPVCFPATTLDELTQALDAAISGPRDKDRACLPELMLPEARLTPIRKQADGGFAPRILTVEDWIKAVSSQGGAPIYEKQVKVKSETYGHFAHLWSTYEIRPTPDGKATVIGINSIQAIFDGNRWRVLSVLWEPETSAGPVPARYLP